MLSIFDPLREFTFWSVVLRLLLAMLSAGIIGYGRSQLGCNAGFRTYILISLGGTLAFLISQYDYIMLNSVWSEAVQIAGDKFDASRLSAQTLTGIGFLGAGTILVVAHHQVNGLTTATGLFATICMAAAIGAGFYECVILSLILIVLVLNVMAPLEVAFKRRLNNITLSIEIDNIDNLEDIRTAIEAEHASIYDVDIEAGPGPASVIVVLKLNKDNCSHSSMLSTVAGLDCVHSVQELIA